MTLAPEPTLGPDAPLFLALRRVDALLGDALGELPPTDDPTGQQWLAAIVADHARVEKPRIVRPDAGCPLPTLQRLERLFALTSFERDVILIALAAELDDRYGPIFTALGASNGRPTVGLVLRVFAHVVHGERTMAMAAVGPTCRMYRAGLLDFIGDGPHAQRELAVRAALWPRLVGQVGSMPFALARRDGVLAQLVLAEPTRRRIIAAVEWARLRTPSDVLIAIAGPIGSGRDAIAGAVADELGTGGLICEAGPPMTPDRVRDLVRETLWHGAALIASGVPATDLSVLARELPAPLIAIADERTIRELAANTMRATIEIEVPAPDVDARARIWTRSLAGHTGGTALDPRALAEQFQLGPGRIHAAAAMALAAGGGREVSASALRIACRSGDRDGSLARRLECGYRPEDLVVPRSTRTELDLVTTWARHGPAVFAPGAAGARLATRNGLVALFTGPPGTGKTMAAQVVARALDRDLLRVDLSQVVNKYIGETEKNLDRVFADADADGAILFFDEADAVFGKRTEVKDAHDRHANLETAFLLQRLEIHRGIVILASNIDKNMDAAFLRRIHVIAEFPLPGPEERLAIWRGQIAADHLAADVDLPLLASRFSIAGGDIRNAAVTAALLAASAGGRVAMRHVVLGLWRELRKSGRLISPDELGPWKPIVLEHLRPSTRRDPA